MYKSHLRFEHHQFVADHGKRLLARAELTVGALVFEAECLATHEYDNNNCR